MTLKYPEQVDTTTADYMIFTAHKYTVNSNVDYSSQGRSGPGTNTGPWSPTRPPGTGLLSSRDANTGKDSLAVGPVVGEPVILYMPNSTPAIGNTNGWQTETGFEGPLGAIKRDIGAHATGAAIDMASPDNSMNMSNLIRGNAMNKLDDAAAQFAVSKIAGFMGVKPSSLTAISRGRIFNPNIEMIYQGPSVRTFQFDFVFLPKNEAEGEIVNKIIKQFKVLSSAKLIDKSYFGVPNLWLVRYMTRTQMNKNMNRFKRAALTNVAVQANQGFDFHSSYQDGMPITTSMSLQFTEVDIITREDHENSQTLQGF
jgi:hypothetical protein